MQKQAIQQKARKGFYFSFDAMLALSVMAAALFVVMQSSDLATDDYRAGTLSYQQSGVEGRDAMKLAASQRFDHAFNESFKEEIVEDTNFTADDLDRTVLDGITLLWAQNTTESHQYAKTAVETYFDPKISNDRNYRLQIGEASSRNVLYKTSDSDNATAISSASRPVSGHRIGRSSEGYQARVGLSEVTKQETETVFFGGYVGDGDVTYNVTLPDLDTVLNVSMEGDFAGSFELYFNGDDAGEYSPDEIGNLSADTFQICTNNVNQSRCESLSSGDNQVEVRFDRQNESSIGGGFLKIAYNRTTGLSPRDHYRTKKAKIPGIDGIINYYGSFYVPGELNGAKANLHYETDNQTFFVRIGNSTVYEKRTTGEQEISIDNETLYQNITGSGMGYEGMSQETVPLRVGLRNLDQAYSRAIADSVSVIDTSGSMSDSMMQDAKDAGKTFGEIILNASGNRAGMVGYESSVSAQHPLTTDEPSLKQSIDELSSGGNTCIACGILESIDTLRNPYVDSFVSRNSEWHYTTDYLDSKPPEIDGRDWKQTDYNVSGWQNGSAIIGSGPDAGTVLENYEGGVYLRKQFYLGYRDYRDVNLSLRTDDAATVYLNGQLVDNDTSEHAGEYWNRESGDELPVLDDSALRTGWNVLAVKLKNDDEADVRNLIINTTEEWDEGTHSDTEASNDQLGLNPTLSGTGESVETGGYSSIEGQTSTDGWTSQSLYIDNMEFRGVDRTTGDNGGYTDATGSITDMLVPGESYGIDVTFETSSGYFASDPVPYASVAFDWDGDGNIDDETAEELGSCSGGSCTVSAEINVPEDAESGSTLMRVIGSAGDYQTEPYGDIGLGEAEDYSAFVPVQTYENGTYTSEMFEAGKPMDWQDMSVESETPSGTDIEIDFSDGTSWYDTVADMPESQEMQYSISLNTTDETVTPTVNTVNMTYEGLVAEFDASLNGSQKRRRSMIVMSDGEPNIEASVDRECDIDGSGSYSGAAADTIDAAYQAQEDHNITVYTVGFGDGADEDLLNMTARCGGGEYYFADTEQDQLENVFRNISNNILNASFVGQTVRTGDEAAFGQLHPDSYLEFNYSANEDQEYGTFGLQQISDRFGGEVESPKNGSFEVPEDVEVESARMTSYSGNRWTDRASIRDENNAFNQFYNLSNYGNEYRTLGDPFLINIPADTVQNGTNKVRVDTALDPSAPEGGSPDNKIFYTLGVSGSVGYGGLFPNETAAREDAEERLQDQLDVDNDGEMDVSLDAEDMNVSATFAREQPYIWGPELVKMVVWK